MILSTSQWVERGAELMSILVISAEIKNESDEA